MSHAGSRTEKKAYMEVEGRERWKKLSKVTVAKGRVV